MEVAMADYIVCRKKRNSPRLNVRICQEKCPFKHECKEYQAYVALSVNPKRVMASPKTQSLVLAT